MCSRVCVCFCVCAHFCQCVYVWLRSAEVVAFAFCSCSGLVFHRNTVRQIKFNRTYFIFDKTLV